MQVWVNGKKINECQFLKKLGFNVVSCTLGVVIDAVANLCDEVAHGCDRPSPSSDFNWLLKLDFSNFTLLSGVTVSGLTYLGCMYFIYHLEGETYKNII